MSFLSSPGCAEIGGVTASMARRISSAVLTPVRADWASRRAINSSVKNMVVLFTIYSSLHTTAYTQPGCLSSLFFGFLSNVYTGTNVYNRRHALQINLSKRCIHPAKRIHLRWRSSQSGMMYTLEALGGPVGAVKMAEGEIRCTELGRTRQRAGKPVVG